MMRRNSPIKSLKSLLLAALLTSLSSAAVAQEEVKQDYQYRLNLSMDWKLFNVKGLKFSLAPQIRYDENFEYDCFKAEAGISYKTFGFLYWGAQYQLTAEPAGFMHTDKSYRYGLSLIAKESFGDFTPSLRILYNNYSDADPEDKQYMRYRVKLKYDIPKCPITPYASTEFFQQMEDNLLYKTRISGGVDYKVKKNRYLCLEYKLDYYALKYKNKHIFELGYKVSF